MMAHEEKKLLKSKKEKGDIICFAIFQIRIEACFQIKDKLRGLIKSNNLFLE